MGPDIYEIVVSFKNEKRIKNSINKKSYIGKLNYSVLVFFVYNIC
jgi:hypothetical protein